MSKPLRKPIKINNTNMTMTTAWIRLAVKLEIASATASDCNEMMPKSIPTGR